MSEPRAISKCKYWRTAKAMSATCAAYSALKEQAGALAEELKAVKSRIDALSTEAAGEE